MALKVFTGFDYGTGAGAVTGNAGSTLFDILASGVSTDISVVSTSPRTGGYCLKLIASASDTRCGWNTSTITGSPTRGIGTFAILLESLPSADTILAQLTSTQQNGRFYFQQSSGKFAVAVEGGTLSADGPVVQANVWYHVEMYYDCSTTTGVIQWQLDGLTRTQATGTVTTGATIDNYTMGGQSATNQTFTARYDDVALWTDTVGMSFPFGVHEVQGLTKDPAVTALTLSGTSTNFQTYSGATPTQTAWNATTAATNIAAVPPGLQASQAGFCCVAIAASDYIEIPMGTYTLSPGESIDGVRLVVQGWQGSATSAQIGARMFNGTTEETIFAGTTAYTALGNNTATPGWFCKLGTTANYDTQAEIDAITTRIGFCGDATPNIGVGAVFVELLVKTILPGTPLVVNQQALVRSNFW